LLKKKMTRLMAAVAMDVDYSPLKASELVDPVEQA
jgi:hypothetical protein